MLKRLAMGLEHIDGYNQRQGAALPPQIFLTEVCGLHCIENYRNCCHLRSDFKAKKAPNSISAVAPPQIPLAEFAALLRHPADFIPALGPPTTCLPKYVSLNPPMLEHRAWVAHFKRSLCSLGTTCHTISWFIYLLFVHDVCDVCVAKKFD